MNYSEYRECIKREIYEYEGKKKTSVFDKFRLRYFSSSTNCTYLCRKMWYLHSKGKLGRFVAKFYCMRILHRFACSISERAIAGKGIAFPHPVGIVIGNAVVGNNVVVYQNCTIGAKNVGDGKRGKFPHIGNDVRIFAGSIVVGDINICDHVWIGANSVVLKDIDEPGVYAGSPVHRIGDMPEGF